MQVKGDTSNRQMSKPQTLNPSTNLCWLLYGINFMSNQNVETSFMPGFLKLQYLHISLVVNKSNVLKKEI